MSKHFQIPQAPTTDPTRTEVTNAATGATGDGTSGVYLFKVVPAAAFVVGTADQQDVTVWVTFGKTPTTPAVNTGWPILMGETVAFVLGDGIKFNAISDTTTVSLVWGRVSSE